MAIVAHPHEHASASYRAVVCLLFVAGGLAIFLFGNNWTSRFPTNDSDLYKWSLPVVFGATALALRGPRRAELRGIALALFAAALANAVLALVGTRLLGLFPSPQTGAQNLAYDKLAQVIPVVLTLIILTLIFDRDLGAVFLKKGDLRWGLRAGVIAFVVFAAIFAAIAVLQANAPLREGLTAAGVPLATIAAGLPWILVFVFANSFMEELWFRGIFLGKLRPVLGASLTVGATALVFASPHFMAAYVTSIERLLFSAIVFGLGLLNGYLMLRSDSIWGSVLTHAGYDLLVIIPLLVMLA